LDFVTQVLYGQRTSCTWEEARLADTKEEEEPLYLWTTAINLLNL